jgi:hypothetical protein
LAYFDTREAFKATLKSCPIKTFLDNAMISELMYSITKADFAIPKAERIQNAELEFAKACALAEEEEKEEEDEENEDEEADEDEEGVDQHGQWIGPDFRKAKRKKAENEESAEDSEEEFERWLEAQAENDDDDWRDCDEQSRIDAGLAPMSQKKLFRKWRRASGSA